jgi:hypothetical protein
MNTGRLFAMTICSAIALLGISGCERAHQRFVPFGGGNVGFALDTKTGQACSTLPRKALPDNGKENSFPFCYDLYKQPR